MKATEFQRQAKIGRLALHEGISRFLREEAVPTGTAPHYVAGFAQRDGSKWRLFGGGSPNTALSTPFDLASVSKPIFATTLAHFVSAGLLSWQTPFREVLPEAVETWAGDQTVEALLSHRSGLQAHVELFRESWGGKPVSHKRLLRRAATSQRDSRASDPLYSDLGYILLGAGLEELTGQALDEVISDVLVRPWGLEIGSARAFHAARSGFTVEVAPTEDQPPRGGTLRGAVHDDNCWALRGNRCSGHAGLFGTLEGVLRFGALVMEGLSSNGAERDVLSPLVASRPGGTLRMGFDGVSGPQSMAGEQAGRETFGHLGFTGTSLWCDPDRRRVTALLSNRVCPNRNNPKIRALRPKIHDFLWLS